MEHTTLIIITSLYALVIFYLGYKGYKGTKTASDYLLAGKEIHPFVMALSYGAAFVSTSAIIGFGGAAAVFGMSLLWLPFLNIFIGIFIAFAFLGSRTRTMGHRLEAHTFPELIGRRFKSRRLQFFSAFIVAAFMPLYTGVVLMGAAKFIHIRLDIAYDTALFTFAIVMAVYVLLGGLKGVMYADALQGGIMFTGMSIILYLVYSKLGGVTEAHSQLAALKPEAMKIFGKAGHEGWTQMPKFGSEFWWIIVSTIIMGVGIGVLAQPQLAVRYMTVKSTRELNRAIFVGGIFILIITGVAYITGALSNVFFFQDPEFGKISLLAANKNVADIIPLFITTYMPKWLGDLFFVTLMAAAMTTVSSQFHAMGTAVGRDIFQSLKPHKSEDKHIITATRIGIIITFIMSVFLAWYLPMKFSKSGTSIIARGTSIFFGLCASTFLPVYLGGLYTKAITKTGAICGAFSGFLASAFWLMFVHLKESSALLLCERFFDAPSILHNTRSGFILWHAVDPLFIGLPVACIVTVIISAVTKKFSEEHIANCFHGIK